LKTVTSILIIKHQRCLQLLSGKDIIKTFSIALGSNPLGPKEFEGDGKTPEGIYEIYHKSEQSEYYKSLGISYPNEKEKSFAEKMGKLAGGQIRIHGYKSSFEGDQEHEKTKNWTAGCIALTNAEMDEIYDWIKVGTKIIIQP
jgi:murein L,D-transpeptidase YafK